jgi:MFS family permease
VVLVVASFGAFLAFLDSTIVNVAFPDIQRSFPDSALSSLSWVLNAYNIVLAAFLVAAGRMADLLGRKRVFVAGVVVFTVASALCALAGTVEQLIAFRVLQGFGAALLIPASLALVVEAFDVSERAHGVGLWGAAAAIASGLGPPGRRRAGRAGELAAGLPRQRAAGHRRGRAGAAVPGREPVARVCAGCPTCSGRCCWPSRSAS